ncbi:MAG: FimV/HubP family polar landmark protein [Gammaproteobacteria bacterium]
MRLPFLNLLVHASWSSGEVTRQYTLLLNPPIFAAGGSPAPVSEPTAPTEPAVQPVSRQPAQQQPAQQVRVRVPVQTVPRSYGPVRPGDTLWHIASRLAGAAGVGVNQMMIALYRANPQAFAGNINRLKAGPELRVPSPKEIEAINLAVADREVASQNQAWRSVRAGGGETSPASASAPVKRGNESNGVTDNAAPDGAAGEVVLTAPEVTATPAAVAGTAGTGVAAFAANGKSATGGETAAALPAASAGGPAKLHNAEMANLAAAAHTAKKPPATHPANTFNSVNTATSPAQKSSGTLQGWLTTPKGWVAIAVVLILIALVLFLFSRRARAARLVAQADVVKPTAPDETPQADALVPAPPDAAESENPAEMALAEADVMVAEADVQETEIPEDDFTLDLADEPPSLPDEQMSAEEEELTPLEEPVFDTPSVDDETRMGDVLAGADFYAGHGDHAGAAAILRTALVREPEHAELRHRLFQELFAAGDAREFRAEAERFREQAPVESDWQVVAVMGRQLLPDDALFTDVYTAPKAPIEESQTMAESASTQEPDAPDLDLELERFAATESPADSPDGFEGSAGELSTMIETYMPEESETPIEAQVPFDETKSEDDGALEFEPEALDWPAATEAEDAQEAESESLSSNDNEETAEEQDISGTQLDLAHAYLDMSDRESARDILEEVLDGGDETQREEAQRLLDTLT